MQIKNELYEATLKRGELKIMLGSSLSCILWGKYWGMLHKVFDSEKYRRSYNIIKIDFSQCYWADPMPLLSVLLELVRLKEDYSKEVRIFLPRLVANNENNVNFYRGQFLKFLASQGFMKIIIDNFYVSDFKEILTYSKIERYTNYNYKLFYNGAEVVQAKIYDVTDSSLKPSIINKIEEEVLFRFKNTVSLQTYNILIEQIYNILNELIENVEKHAYRLNEKKRFGLYIRKRYGAVKNYGRESKVLNSYSDILKKEKKNCPALDNQILIEGEAVLEIFFVDIGMGLRGSLKEYYTKQLNKQYKYPVRELFCKVLKDGVRRETLNSITPFGGLHFISRILQDSNGYIWCNEGKEWIGTASIGLLKGNVNDVKVALTESEDQLQNTGLLWCFRIPYSDISKSRNSIAQLWKSIPSTHPVFKAYQELDRDLCVSRVICKDDRYNNCILMNGTSINWKNNFDKQEKDNISSYSGKIDTYIWFPKPYYSKNMIITILKKYIEGVIKNTISESQKVNIIIGEIDSNELTSFYYALNNMWINVLRCEQIASIILITKRWEVIFLENIEQHLRNSLEKSLIFWSYTSNNSAKVHENIKEYAKMLRKYDSYLFWNFIKVHQQEKIYINADIVWNNEMTVNGYLDFERVYLYEDIYLLLKNALLRTSGFVNNSEIVYKNIDQASARICQEANITILYSDYKTVHMVNVGSACATGYTREYYYKENKADINVIFFAHPSFEKKINDTAFLLIWPELNFFTSFLRENETYYRLGKTNLITKNCNEMLIDTIGVYKNSVRNKKETYLDFQKKYPKFIKYGHYKTDKHHYLIGFDLLTYIKYSYLKKEGAFVYFLWKIITYLGKGEEDKVYINIKDKEWIRVLKDCEYNDRIDNGEVIVYHSNTFTEYIIKLVKDVLPDSLVKRMIPINIIEIQPKGAPVTFSPITLDLLKSIFKDKDKVGIMYFDSSFSTGRKMMEIENILLSTGCSKVTFLSVFDMRRLRNEDIRNYSYWKINIPRLDDDAHCILCNTLKMLENFRDKVDKKINFRIQDWFTNWKSMSITNSISGHGIEIDEEVKCNVDAIPISDSNTLNICIAEKLCESYSNDYVYKFINRKTNLSIYLKMQLICTQICLYGNQNSRQLQLNLLSELVGSMAKSEIVNAYTSLAGIVLISQPEYLIYELLNEILYVNQEQKVLSIKKFFLDSENLDLVIAIGYFVKNFHIIEQLVNGYENRYKGNFKLIKLINEHLLPEKELKLLSKEFEGLLINEQGRRHNTNIQKLLMEHVTDFDYFKERCQCVRNDINRLYELSKHFPIALANSRVMIDNTHDDIKDIIIEMENLMLQEEENYSKKIMLGTEIKRFSISEELKSIICKCKDGFEVILNSYFIEFSEETKQYFAQLVAKYAKKYGKDVKLKVSRNENIDNLHKWYYWNQGIEKEFQYLLENLEHCTKNIENINGNAQMIIEIYFDFNIILIQLKSWSEKTADIVKDAFWAKNRLSKEQAIAFDVMFDFENLQNSNEGDFLLETKMSVPACFQQLKGE